MRSDTATPRQGPRLRRLTRRGREQAGARFIEEYRFPPSVMRNVARDHPELAPDALVEVEAGLREWLVCCAHRDGHVLGMPSRAVDWAWHHFILSTHAYHAFCERAYGEYLHHTPEADMLAPMDAGMAETVRAWDRGEAGAAGREASLWDLDERLGIEDPIGVPEPEKRAARELPGYEPVEGPQWRGRRRDPWATSGYAFPWFGGDGPGGCGGGCGGGG